MRQFNLLHLRTVPCKSRMFPLSKHAQLLLRKANVGPPPGHGQQHFGMLLDGGSARNGSHSSPVVFAIGSHFEGGILKESLPFQT